MGRVMFTFAPRNDFGVLDHDADAVATDLAALKALVASR